MKSVIFLLLFFLFCNGMIAQSTFQRVYPFTNPSIPMNFVSTLDGNYLIYGAPSYPNFNSVYLMKINNSGDTLWTKSFDFPGFQLNGLIETHDSGLVIFGPMNSFTTILKLNQYGDSLWLKQYTYTTQYGNSCYGVALRETDDHGFFVESSHDDSDIVYYDIQFSKLDSLGNIQWRRDYNLDHDYIGPGYVIKRPDNYFMVHVYRNMGGPSIPYGNLLLVDSIGNITAIGYTDQPGYRGGDYMAEGPDGNFTVIGNYRTYWEDDPYGSLMKLNTSGAIIWNKQYPHSSPMKSVASVNDNGCIVACDSTLYTNEFQLKRFDSGGSLISSNLYPIDHRESASAVHQTSDGGYLAVGYHVLQSGQIETYIVKTDSAGQLNSNGYNISMNNSSPCQDDTVILTIQNAISYLWSDGQTNQSIAVTRNGNYNVRVEDSPGNFYYTTFENIYFNPKPTFSIGNDTTICTQQSIILDAGNGFVNYFWQDGSSLQTYLASGLIADTTLYSVQVTDTNGCVNSDTLQIIFDICTGIGSNDLNGFMYVRPNTSNGLFVISIRGIEGKTDICVYDLNGRMVFDENAFIIGNTFDMKINLQTLSQGTYLLCLKTEKGIRAEKICKE